MKATIELTKLGKKYPTFQLHDINFTLPGGTIMGLIGENGAGKSTLIKCLLGLTDIDQGTATVLGLPAGTPTLGDDIGVVLDGCPFYQGFTIPQVEKICSQLYSRWDSDLFAHYLTRYQLPSNKKIKEFSRGMQMKLTIAVALAHHPKLLVLDEPTSGLDPAVRTEILDDFLDFIQDDDHSILISSHITSDLEKIADYVTFLHQGSTVISGEKDEFLANYGRLVCTQEDLVQVDRALLIGLHCGQFHCEALVANRQKFAQRYPHLTVDRVTLEDIMIFTVQEGKE